MPDRQRLRLDRQLQALGRRLPVLKRLITFVNARPGVLLRVPLALFLMMAGLLGFLPMLGFWMIPLGFVILAIDLPLLQPAVTTTMIRFRRRGALWWRQFRDRGKMR